MTIPKLTQCAHVKASQRKPVVIYSMQTMDKSWEGEQQHIISAICVICATRLIALGKAIEEQGREGEGGS